MRLEAQNLKYNRSMCFVYLLFECGMQAQISGWRRLADECWLVMGWECGNVVISMCCMHVLEACVRQWIQVANDSSCRLATAKMKILSFPCALMYLFDVACKRKPQAGDCLLVSAGWG